MPERALTEVIDSLFGRAQAEARAGRELPDIPDELIVAAPRGVDVPAWAAHVQAAHAEQSCLAPGDHRRCADRGLTISRRAEQTDQDAAALGLPPLARRSGVPSYADAVQALHDTGTCHGADHQACYRAGLELAGRRPTPTLDLAVLAQAVADAAVHAAAAEQIEQEQQEAWHVARSVAGDALDKLAEATSAYRAAKAATS